MFKETINAVCREIESKFLDIFKSDTDSEDRPTGLLYHYTSAAGLQGIIESKQLWATNTLYLNDSSELKNAVEVVRSEIDKKPLNLQGVTEFLQRTITAHLDDLPIDHFVTSFCEDGDLLSQWRGYGQYGSGYSIGFDPVALLAATRRNTKDKNAVCVLRKVKYKEAEKQKMIQKRLDVLRAILERLAEQLNARADEEIRQLNTLWFNIAASFSPIMPLMKDPAFEEEREWRIIQTVWKKPVPTASRPVNLRVLNGKLIPYVRIDWPLANQSEIPDVRGLTEVCCGPSSEPELKKMAVKDLLVAGDCYKSRVVVSKVPLRT